MKNNTYKYSFLYWNREQLLKLINYLEKTYKLKFITINDISSIVSISLKIFGLNLFNEKEVIFEAPHNFLEVEICKRCHFPAKWTDTEFYDNDNKRDKQCKNCGEPLYKWHGETMIGIKNKIIIQKLF